MDYEKVESFRRTSPSLKLLHAKNLALIIGFLYREFKEPNRITIPNFELVDKLADYVEYYDNQGNVLEEPTVRAKRYIDEWCSDDHNYLRKSPDENGVDVLELTPYTEKVIQWLQDLDKREFVGTESRFLDIFHKLRELVENSTEDPEQRIAALEKRKQEIEEQIQHIRDFGVVSFDDTQIKERFYEVNRLARELLSDFHEVKQNFKEIVRNTLTKINEIFR